MNKVLKLCSAVLLGSILITSCSKPKYTASFSPSKNIKYVKNTTPTSAPEKTVTTPEAVATITQMAAPTTKEEVNMTKQENVTLPTSSFTKTEIKQLKKEVRKQIFKQVKHSIFHKSEVKKQNGDAHILNIILCFFIPPLAVFLHQEQRISNDFWLDLVLLLTLVGSVIYALLVVLDVVSIA